LKTKLPILLLTLVLALTMAVPLAFGAPSVMVDGKKVNFDVEPGVENGRTLVPVRAIFEALNAKVKWVGGETKPAVLANKGATEIKLEVGSITAYRNGVPIKLDVPARVVNNRTMVPIRFIGESFGDKVDWNNKTETIVITSAITIADVDLIKETVTIRNNSVKNFDLTGWYLRSKTAKEPYQFPDGYTLKAGSTAYIHSGPMATESLPAHLFWSKDYMWNNDEDQANLYDSTANIVYSWPR